MSPWEAITGQHWGRSSGGMNENEMWRTIWALDVPHVVKMFSWQACNDLLPTRENLCKKRVTDDGKCHVCLVEDETTCHVLWKCPATRDVWGGDSSLFQKCAWEGCKFMHLFEYCSHRFNREVLVLMAVIARKIWLRRNSLIFEGFFADPS
jgi:hypothetical protein